jgi:4-oxalmesaconate hydratase
MIIDSHAHLVAPPSLYAYRSSLTVSRGQHGFYKQTIPDEELAKSAANNVKLMDDVGTDMQLLSPRPYMLVHGNARWDDARAWAEVNNDLIARTQKMHPTRFRGVAGLPQIVGAPVTTLFDEIKRVTEEYGFVAVLVNPDPAEGLNTSPTLSDPYWYPLYEKLCQLDLPMHVHSANCCGRETYDEHFVTEESLAITSLARSDVFKRYPSLKVLISHGGGSIPYQIGRWRSNRQMEIKAGRLPKDFETFDTTLKRFWFDTCLHNQKSLELLFDVVGTDRCLFGTERPGSGAGVDPVSGRPYEDIRPTIEAITSLTKQDKDAIFEGNARKVFKHLNLK